MKIPVLRGFFAACGAFSAVLCLAAAFTALSCVSSFRAEEYYAVGAAYLDMKQYAEAEKWFTRSKFNAKTKMASLYNLGRVTYEQGRYEEAMDYFGTVLKKDPQNITALKAAAYTCVKTGNHEDALDYYRRILELIPGSADESYNYALLLASMDRNAEAEEVLNGLGDKSDDALLLLARVQRALNKPEAVDAYSAYLKKKDDPAVRFEFAEVLEDQKLYARAFGEYSAASEKLSTGGYPEKSLVVFRMARTLLVSEPSNKQGPALLEEAIKSGYRAAEELDALLEKTSLPAARKTELRALYQ